MQIKLKKLRIVNFKGIVLLEILFINASTFIYGDNATGKTTILDAFLWLFFGKNSEGLAQFEAKRLDENNRFIKDLECEVEAVFDVDDQEIAARKVLRQKWVKRRGELESNYNGDENVYFWNDVPMKEGEFKTKIAGIIDENLFRMITNPLHFNSLKWQDRRNMLIQIAGNITNQSVLDSVVTSSNKGQFDELIKALNAGKSLDEFKRELAAKKKKVKDESEFLPSRIDEVRKGMPQVKDFAGLRTQLQIAQGELDDVQTKMNDAVQSESIENTRRSGLLREYNQQVNDRQQKIFGIKQQLQNIEFEVRQQADQAGSQLKIKVDSINRSIGELNNDITKFSNAVEGFKKEIEQKEATLNQLRSDYVTEDEKLLVFDEHVFNCPTCKQVLPEATIESSKETLTANFNRDKLSKLNEIQAKAGTIKEEISALNGRINTAGEFIKTTQSTLDAKNEELAGLNDAMTQATSPDVAYANILGTHEKYQQLKTELQQIEAIILTEPVFETTQLTANAGLKMRQNQLNETIANLNKELATEEQITKANARIKELSEQEGKLSQELLALEGSEFAIMEFTKAKVDAIERRINGMFKSVKFKMFNQQVNGGETECCDTLVNSNGSFVPFNDANNAARINAGIDIINTLCKHYDVYAPIFIDNREAVTKLEESQSQVVNLIVSGADKQLRVA